MNHKQIPKSFRAHAQESVSGLAVDYGVSERMIYKWREKLGIPSPRTNSIDYCKMDDLIKSNKSTTEIMAIMGCVKSTVNDRKRKVLKRAPRINGPEIHVERRETVVPPSNRLEQFIAKRMRQFHQTREVVTNWLHNTVAGQSVLKEYPIR